MTGSAMPGHLTSYVRGHFSAKGSSLNHLGAATPITALHLRVGKVPQRYKTPTQADRELQAKQNKQNKTTATAEAFEDYEGVGRSIPLGQGRSNM